MCLFREREESVMSKHNQQRKKKKRESIQIHTQERTCVLCSIVIPLNLPFIKRKKKSTSEEEKATKLSLPPIMVVLYCFFDSTPQAISETLSWFELVLSKKKK